MYGRERRTCQNAKSNFNSSEMLVLMCLRLPTWHGRWTLLHAGELSPGEGSSGGELQKDSTLGPGIGGSLGDQSHDKPR